MDQPQTLRIAIAQLNPIVGDIAGIGPVKLARLGMARSFQLPRPFVVTERSVHLRDTRISW
jgi:ABC-type branched-subunit amino acid transport system ATPase component